MEPMSYLTHLVDTEFPPAGAPVILLEWEPSDRKIRNQISMVLCADAPDTVIRCTNDEGRIPIKVHLKMLAIYSSHYTEACYKQAERTDNSGTLCLNLNIEYSVLVAIFRLLYFGKTALSLGSKGSLIDALSILGMQDVIERVEWCEYPVGIKPEHDPVATTSDTTNERRQSCNISSSSSSSSSSEDEGALPASTASQPATKRPRNERRSMEHHVDEAILLMFHLVAQKSIKMAELVKALEDKIPYSTVYGRYRELFGKVNNSNRPESVNAEMRAKADEIRKKVDDQNPGTGVERARRILAAMRSAVNAEQQQQQHLQQQQQLQNTQRPAKRTLDGDTRPRIDGNVPAGLPGITIPQASVIPPQEVDDEDKEILTITVFKQESGVVRHKEKFLRAKKLRFLRGIREK